MAVTTTTQAATTAAAASQSQRSGSKLTENFDSFLKLLTAQLEHQDPLSPMDATQFTNQLVQFSTIEQAIQSNSHLEKLTDLLESDGLTSALDFIGTEVGFDSDQIRLGATGDATFAYRLPQAAAEVRITVRDAKGAIVREAAGQPGAGDRAFVWDGKGANGQRLATGLYRVEVAATDAAGGAVQVASRASGVVEGVETGSDGLRLLVEGVPVSLDQVRNVVRRSAAAAG